MSRKMMNNNLFLKSLFEKNENFKKGLFRVLEEYKGQNHKLLIEDKFGKCRIKTIDLLYNNYKPRIESAIDKTEYFINKSNEIHSFKYTYDYSKYMRYKNDIIITCKTHGNFNQTPNNHLSGKGCPKCGNENKSDYQKENPTGWTLTNWINKASSSVNFDSFKVYIIKVFDENEIFYKIGRTYNTLHKRFIFSKTLPYKYEVYKIYKGNAKEMFNLENKLKRNNKNNKYIPNKKFDGMYECFSKIEEIYE